MNKMPEFNIFTGDDLSYSDVKIYSFYKYGSDQITCESALSFEIISSWINGGWVDLANETANAILKRIFEGNVR